MDRPLLPEGSICPVLTCPHTGIASLEHHMTSSSRGKGATTVVLFNPEKRPVTFDSGYFLRTIYASKLLESALQRVLNGRHADCMSSSE